jgi:RNA polymerase sigma-70 factor (ECF subfamily)
VICLYPSDTALILRCQERDPAAFDEIVARYKQKIHSYVCRMIGDSDDAEDVTQDVFVKMYVAIPSFRSEASVSTWLFRIAGNLCIDRFRKKQRRSQGFGGDLLSLDAGYDNASSGRGESGDAQSTIDVPDLRSEPQSNLERVEMDSKVQDALKGLPEKLRAAIILHDIEGFEYEQIAQIEQCPLGTVKSRIFNARMQMRKLLLPYLND